MSAESESSVDGGPEVKMVSERRSVRHQWARGLFYRREGGKETIHRKRLFWVLIVIFFGLVTLLLLQEPPPPPASTQKSSIPDAVNQLGKSQSYPVRIGGDSAVSQGDDSHRGSPRSGSRRGKAHAFSGPELHVRPKLEHIPPGSLVRAVLASGGSNGPVRAVAKESLRLSGETLIPEGTVFLGQGQSGKSRLLIRFTKMVFRDGTTQDIAAQAVDGIDHIAGLQGSSVGSGALRLMTGIGLNFVGGFGSALQDNEAVGMQAMKKASLKNALLNGSATAALDQSKEMMSTLRNEAPVFEVPEGTEIGILIEGK